MPRSWTTSTSGLLKVKWQNKVPDTDIFERTNMLQKHQLSWARNIVRLSNKRLIKRFLYGELKMTEKEVQRHFKSLNERFWHWLLFMGRPWPRMLFLAPCCNRWGHALRAAEHWDIEEKKSCKQSLSEQQSHDRDTPNYGAREVTCRRKKNTIHDDGFAIRPLSL